MSLSVSLKLVHLPAIGFEPGSSKHVLEAAEASVKSGCEYGVLLYSRDAYSQELKPTALFEGKSAEEALDCCKNSLVLPLAKLVAMTSTAKFKKAFANGQNAFGFAIPADRERFGSASKLLQPFEIFEQHLADASFASAWLVDAYNEMISQAYGNRSLILRKADTKAMFSSLEEAYKVMNSLPRNTAYIGLGSGKANSNVAEYLQQVRSFLTLNGQAPSEILNLVESLDYNYFLHGYPLDLLVIDTENIINGLSIDDVYLKAEFCSTHTVRNLQFLSPIDREIYIPSSKVAQVRQQLLQVESEKAA